MDFESKLWQGKPVYLHYAQLKNHLNQYLGESSASLFAEPLISNNAFAGKGSATWTSTYLSNEARKLSELNASEQARYQALLGQKISVITQYAQQLLESEDRNSNKWGQLIMRSIEIPDFSHVMVEGEQIVLVLWGFKAKAAPMDSASLRTLTPIAAPPFDATPSEASTFKVPSKPTAEIDAPIKMQANNEEEDVPMEEDSISNANEQEENRLQSPPDQPPPPDNGESFRKWYKRWGWWYLLMFLMLAFLAWLLRDMLFPYDYLPEAPNVIVPIDTTKVTLDDDEVKLVAGDRLNIALLGDNPDMAAFSKAFKKEYPQKKYQIIYYDTLTNRIQLEVPEDERSAIKAKLKEQLTGFEFLVWMESMFEQKRQPSDPVFKSREASWYFQEVQAYEAWNISMGDSSLIIAVIDDGFDLNHPEFQDKVYKPWNVVTNQPLLRPSGGSPHGTHVGGTAAGSAYNNAGGSGIAPNCRLMPIQVGDINGNMSTTAIIDGILYAIHNGAQVINLSLGLIISPEVVKFQLSAQQKIVENLYKDEEQFWGRIFHEADRKNITIVLAAGNQDVLIGLDPMQRGDNTIKVSAIDPNRSKATFSNFGNLSTISAPGVQIFNSFPGGSFGYLDGTSMASPIVAGGVALMKSVNPGLSTAEIIDIFQSTGIPVRNMNEKNIGNIIQLGKAMDIADKNRQRSPVVDCPDIQEKIDSLLREVRRLKSYCEEGDLTIVDTMKIPTPEPENPKDFSFAEGRWKSTTNLYNEEGEKVQVYFDFFNDGSGEITLMEPDNNICNATLAIDLEEDLFIINQTRPANCSPESDQYNPYYFECKPDRNGNASCIAKNKVNANNIFKFNLIKFNAL